MDLEYIESLAELVSATTVAEVTVRRGERSVTLRRRPGAVAVFVLPEAAMEPSGVQSTDITPLPSRPVLSGLPVVVGSDTALVPLMTERPEPRTEIVKARRVGIFHRGGTAGADPLVRAGDWVAAGQQIGAIESMGLYDEVDAPVSGRVMGVFAEDGRPVEYGQQVFHIEVSDQPETVEAEGEEAEA